MSLQFATGLVVPKNWQRGVTFYRPGPMLFALPESYTAPHGSIKDQGQCGSCSHFASIAVLESVIMRKNGGVEVDLSEQSVLDCAQYENGKCQGSFYHGRHLVENGAPLDRDYPYQGRATQCRKLAPAFEKPVAQGYIGQENGWPGEQALRQALYEKGALWVTVYADASWNAPGEVLRQGGRGQSNHAVTCVGYKPDPVNPGKYLFLIKNSWGTKWNNGGYVWIAHQVSNFGETAAFLELAGSPAPGPIPDPFPPEPTPGPTPGPTPDPTPGPCEPATLSLPKRMRVTSGDEILVGVKPQTGYTYAWFEMNGDGTQGKQIANTVSFFYKATRDVVLKVVAGNTCGIAECSTEIELARSFAGSACTDCE